LRFYFDFVFFSIFVEFSFFYITYNTD